MSEHGTTIAVRDDSMTVLSRCELMDVGLVMPDDVNFDEYTHLMRLLVRLDHATPFMIGDAMNAGEDKWGEEAPAAWPDFAKSSVQTYQSVCRRVPLQRRKEGLTFQHHRVVTPLKAKDQTAFLKTAFEKEWSAARLAQEVNIFRGKETKLSAGERLRIAARSLWASSKREQDGEDVFYVVPQEMMYDLLDALGEATPEGENNGA